MAYTGAPSFEVPPQRAAGSCQPESREATIARIDEVEQGLRFAVQAAALKARKPISPELGALSSRWERFAETVFDYRYGYSDQPPALDEFELGQVMHSA